MMTEDLNFRMTDLEEQLAAPDGALVQAVTLSALAAAGERISSQIAAGLPPAEYELAKKAYEGLAAAHEIISVFPTGKHDQQATSERT
ncbi:EscE/YscE/SsaE family type III secretion system needle protein co-chaperone [Cognatiyoonia sp. IB215182]|uniref:EscE/YscE/SsaE family type III secretion system needle protein co-chaperone n=1 Tax=Cognatiyoonia sp. IB215182 TaxID=3097353 RepID=UPI002A241500|nr:EscE/YscE/SsaE family type III secretion system needle protein co-chaperone [Cognatiyoonia sp. IB215182]